MNSVDILNTIIEHGSLAGIVVFSGMNMNIQGNCIEGIEGPAIVSSNMDSLTISNNYFESNNIGNASCSECVGPNGNKGQVSGEHDRLQRHFSLGCVLTPLAAVSQGHWYSSRCSSVQRIRCQRTHPER